MEKEHDIKVVRVIDEKYSRQCFEIVKQYPKKFKHYESALIANYIVCLMDGERVLGFVSLVDDKAFSGDLYILQVAVDRSEQGKGYGRVLLEYVKKHSKGFKRVVSDIRKDNSPSINLHKKVGMKILGVCDYANSFTFGVMVDSIIKNDYISYTEENKELT